MSADTLKGLGNPASTVMSGNDNNKDIAFAKQQTLGMFEGQNKTGTTLLENGARELQKQANDRGERENPAKEAAQANAEAGI